MLEEISSIEQLRQIVEEKKKRGNQLTGKLTEPIITSRPKSHFSIDQPRYTGFNPKHPFNIEIEFTSHDDQIIKVEHMDFKVYTDGYGPMSLSYFEASFSVSDVPGMDKIFSDIVNEKYEGMLNTKLYINEQPYMLLYNCAVTYYGIDAGPQGITHNVTLRLEKAIRQ